MTKFTLKLDDIERFGSGLARPECVACTAAGAIWVSHALPGGGGGVARVDAEGVARPLLADEGAPDDFMPNGWAMAPDGSFLIANLGDSGGVWRLAADGSVAPVLMTVDGVDMPPVNFVHRDEEGRLWVSVSTCRVPRDRAFHRDVADGFVVLMDADGARIVADGLGYANEVKVHPSGKWLYAHETMARRLSRYPLTGQGLGPRQTVVEYVHGVIPDGFEFDVEGGIWCASVMSNRIVRVTPDGEQHIVVEDCEQAAVDEAMGRWEQGSFTREQMNIGATRYLANIASITFGGDDLKTVYLGSLFGDSLFRFRSPVAGVTPPHWGF